MRINNNIMALNAHRQLGINNTATAKSLEKLSSGFRINRAGDDAAGLAISEKMRGQIRGLNMASKNAQDGISLIQTAEGALTETHAILQRMRELAVQSANDTNVAVDRSEIQKEVDQLAKEITRIADTTEFNTQKLLDGKFEGKFHIGANEKQNVELVIGDMGAEKLGVQGEAYSADVEGINGLKVISRDNNKALTINFELADKVTDEVTASYDKDTGEITVTLAAKAKESPETEVELDTNKSTHAAIKSALESVADKAGIQVATGEGFEGTTNLETEPQSSVTIGSDNWTVDKDASKEVGIDVSTQEAADAAITTINDAIETVSAERSKLGAMQNRLEHTIKNLDTSAENLQAAESRIRDVDMAKEMMEFTKQNILQQAATAMLAQANMAPQTVLKLLG